MSWIMNMRVMTGSYGEARLFILVMIPFLINSTLYVCSLLHVYQCSFSIASSYAEYLRNEEHNRGGAKYYGAPCPGVFGSSRVGVKNQKGMHAHDFNLVGHLVGLRWLSLGISVSKVLVLAEPFSLSPSRSLFLDPAAYTNSRGSRE